MASHYRICFSAKMQSLCFAAAPSSFFQIVVKLLDWKKANFELSRTKSPYKKEVQKD